MEVTLLLVCETFSVNKLYYNQPGFKRTQEAREWSHTVFNELNCSYNRDQMRRFREAFQPAYQAIEVTIVERIPVEQYFKVGSWEISSKTFDRTNIEKPLVDLIFLPKYFTRSVPDGCNNLNLDDKYIYQVVSRKEPSPFDYTYVTVTLKILDNKERFTWVKRDTEELL